MNSKSREETFHNYMNSEILESSSDKISLILHNSSQQIVQYFIAELDLRNLNLSNC